MSASAMIVNVSPWEREASMRIHAALLAATLAWAPVTATASVIATHSTPGATPSLHFIRTSSNSGTLTTGGDQLVTFAITGAEPTYPPPGFPLELDANFNLDATVTNGFMSGHMTFTYAGTTDFTYKGVDYAPGAVLLDGIFTGGLGIRPKILYDRMKSFLWGTWSFDVLDFLVYAPRYFVLGGILDGRISYTDKYPNSFSFYSESQLFASTPEPSSWALMILGFASAGGALRQARAPKLRAARKMPRHSLQGQA
jgi:hypothetical protein